MDLAKQKILTAYDSMLFPEEEDEQMPPVIPVPDVKEEKEPVEEPEEEPHREETEEKSGMPAADPFMESMEEAEEEPKAEPEPVPAAEPEQNGEPQADKPIQEQSLFGTDEYVVRPSRRSRLISLYEEEKEDFRTSEKEPEEENVIRLPEDIILDSEPDTVPEPEPEPVPEPISVPEPEPEPEPEPQDVHAEPLTEEPVQVLGEVIGENVRTIGDTMVHPKDVAQSAPIESLSSEIKLAERFMIIRDLFGGDEPAYLKAIAELDRQPSLEDSILYIEENYSWPVNSDSTRLVMDLLQRKFS